MYKTIQWDAKHNSLITNPFLPFKSSLPISPNFLTVTQ
ncbi:hypothetical protein F0Z19_0424 [Vibrio cyclitrophicus]|nr:hypothetical protein M565_ctg5P1444 [Vibrio cyclitrophicus FF75]KAA8602891.1 hypothetical protein F0Z19_0424 [Vibrio cyclitrophicus]